MGSRPHFIAATAIPARGVRMQNAGHLAARAMDRAVDNVARAVHVVIGVRLPDHLAIEVDLGADSTR